MPARSCSRGGPATTPVGGRASDATKAADRPDRSGAGSLLARGSGGGSLGDLARPGDGGGGGDAGADQHPAGLGLLGDPEREGGDAPVVVCLDVLCVDDVADEQLGGE